MARAVNVRIVAALDLGAVGTNAVVGLVLNVSGVDRDTTSLLLRSLIDLVVGGELGAVRVGQGQNLRDRSGQGGLAVVDMADGADIDMGLASIEHLLCH